MSTQIFLDLARNLIDSNSLSGDNLLKIAQTPEKKVLDLLPGANLIRQTYFKNQIHLCTICNGKSGKCSEDCSFCAQSKYHDTRIDTHPLLSRNELQYGARGLDKTPVNRYSIVTSGKGLSKREINRVCQAYEGLPKTNLSFCASLGIIERDDFERLAQSGVNRYHHNLETAKSHFKNICTTHTYQQRIDTIKAAKKAGLSVCSGGIFGMGETDEQILELALELKHLDVDAVPLNFLCPIPGTPLEKASYLTPLKCLKIIALFRYVLPRKEIIVCGGRADNLKSLHSLIFFAGASAIMTGNYLTTDGRQLENDLELLKQSGLVPRNKNF